MLPTIVCRASRGLSFELGINTACYPRLLFELHTPTCSMSHVVLAASDASARRVFTPHWGLVVLSHVSCQGALVGVVYDSEAVHVLYICIELASGTICPRL